VNEYAAPLFSTRRNVMKSKLFTWQRLALQMVCLFVLLTSAAYADDMDGFTLKGVIVQTNDGREISAYVRWNPAWFYEGAHFPDSLFNRKTREELPGIQSLFLYTEVYPVARGLGFAGRFLVTTSAQRIELPLAQVARIIAIRRPYDGYQEIGEIPTVNASDALRWLTSEKPQALVEEYEELFGKLISYNRAVSKSELQQLLRQMRQWEAQTRQQLERAQSEDESARIWRKAVANRDRRLPIFIGC
jgi:hypothetical protein